MRSPSLPLRIAILECDAPLPTTKATYGGYGGVFESLLHRGAASLSNPHIQPSDLTITKFHVEGDSDGNTPYPSLDSVDAILLTGSKHDSFADSPWILRLVEFTKGALADERVKVIGVCFGHQIVGRALGCGVGRNEEGWEAAVCGVDLNEKGKEIFGMEEMNIHQMHRDIIYSPLPSHLLASSNPSTSTSTTITPTNSPSSSSPTTAETNRTSSPQTNGHTPQPNPTPQLKLTSLASSPTCAIQSLYTPHKLLTIQGHPEFTREIMTEILQTRHKTGIFDDESFETYMGKVGRGHDGVGVGGVFVRFVSGEL